MNLHLDEKVIIVTGGAKGIGYGICEVLAGEGAIPVIVGRNESDNQKAIRAIEEKGGKAGAVIGELTDPEACANAVAEVLKKFGRIDGLVNNAGVNDGVSLENGSYEQFVASINKSLTHYYLMAHLVLPELKKNRGAIVNIGSKTSLTGQGGTSGYAAANGGRNALTREWAVELLPYNIRVNAVIVSECYTPQYAKWIKTFPDSEEKLKTITERIPLEKRMTTAEEIANTVAFLLSDRSSHTTGQLLYVDGGYVHLDRALT
ncbi:SDR family oxidoreductase [Sinomicrobium weinanense]|uniref:SDR family oxidoreductase n=1 Tax=Sinomicrobium weinanense TaxID=2842200 RepID=A0A926JVG6_9FLAO|nr:SDR family oxidoreductase [Sinomicrobium weinanense]MBC9798109.1 SDR family oxidoreductase [Sinomicrobium weinanense]MBU3122997.1 SDR family oxidoreductase [Sinomicrobium weinanense]